ncbi:WD40 repeat domain-containing protein [Desulfosarcina ovata]|uniref:Novel STAND NTPase 1 domain-containing protein n=1 Tax=Desulfosarcina ovata subsp. ovata TaxID=2752305 RepID=A0A5K8AFD7_9BACT|nr:WD40 repeat domain-containing protein [Desulfosarcina ovata]BBO91218.1 hypothetical protein DSCOOX_43980 [Desulfosarcina ovata subsp. ovata]
MSEPAANPFVGLRPFESRDSLYYFGRGEQTKALLRQLNHSRFLSVVGSSGSGKSSLVRAGLIPNLEAGFLIQDRDLWKIATMKPGDTPLENLAAALITALDSDCMTSKIDDLVRVMRTQGALGLSDWLQPPLINADANLLLLVDQFEELFREGRSRDSASLEKAADFVGIMLRLAEQKRVPVYVCLTMRSDFLGDCDRFAGLPEAMNRSQYLVPRLTRDQRREAIGGPIRLSGATITPRLMDHLLNENAGTRDDLPILQHALMRTWDQWSRSRSGPIDEAHYEAIGTIRKAIRRHADEAIAELSESDRELTGRIFQAITETDAGNRQVRCQAHLHAIAEVCGCIDTPERVLCVLDGFRRGNRNFVVFSSEKAEDNPLIDISHESLIRQWPTLHQWVADEAESAGIYRRLADTARRFGRHPDSLYRGTQLDVTLQWQEKQHPTVAWARRYHPDFEAAMAFLNQSRRARDEAIEGEKRRQRKRLRQVWLFTSVLFLITVAACFFGWQAYERKRQALEHSRIARANELEANYNLAKVFEEKALSALARARMENATDAYQDAFLYTAEAYAQEIAPDRDALEWSSIGPLLAPDNIQQALACRWFSPVLCSAQEALTAVSFSPAGDTLASGSDDTTITIWSTASGKRLKVLNGHQGTIFSLVFSSDGKILASSSDDRTIRLWDTATGRQLKVIEGNQCGIFSVAISSDDKMLAGALWDNTIRLWNLVTGRQLKVLEGHTGGVFSVAFSGDDKMLASGSWDKTVRIWDVASGRQSKVLSGHDNGVYSVAFSPDGKTLASASIDRSIRIWEIASGRQIKKLEGHRDGISSIAFSPDGKTLASASDDRTVRLWDTASGQPAGVFFGHTDEVYSVAFSPDGMTVVSGANDKTVRIWDVAPARPPRVLEGHTKGLFCVAFSPDNRTLASASWDRTVRLWDVASGKPLKVLKGHDDGVYNVAFSPDNRTLASASWDRTVRLWDVTSGKPLTVLKGHTNGVYCVAFSPDARTLASASWDKTVRLWDVASGKPLTVLKGHTNGISNVAFSPDARTLASASWDKTVRLWDAVSGESLRVLREHTDGVLSVAIGPDARTLASASWDNTIRVWDMESGRELNVLRGHTDFVHSVAFSPDGRMLASTSADDTVRLWDTATGHRIRILAGHTDDAFSATFSADGHTLASGAFDKTVRIWDISTYSRFLDANRPTPMLRAFARGARFLWRVERDGLGFRRKTMRSPSSPQDDDGSAGEQEFRPLLEPPPAGQTKYDQLMAWARNRVKTPPP